MRDGCEGARSGRPADVLLLWEEPDACEEAHRRPDVSICDECVDLCNEVIEEEIPSWPWHRETPKDTDPPS